MNWEKTYLDLVVSGKRTEEEKCISILQARGFLIERSNLYEHYYISDNACPEDKDYLKEILKGPMGNCQFGDVEKNTIYIKKGAKAWDLFRHLFIDIDLSIIDGTSCFST